MTTSSFHLKVWVVAWASGAAALAACAQTSPDAPLHFSEVPEIFAQNPALFSALIRDAHSQTRRGLILGDSQETSPDGRGGVYVPRLNYEIWTRFHNAPESAYIAMNSSFGGGHPYSDWLSRTAKANPGVSASRLPFSALPPGVPGCSTSTTDGANVNSNQLYGQLVQLQFNAASIDVGCQIAGTGAFFDMDQPLFLDVIAATNPTASGQIRVRVAATQSDNPSYYAPTIQTFESDMELVHPGPTKFLTQRFGPLNTSGMQFPQVELSGTDPNVLTDIVTCKFVGGGHPAGITLTSLGNGGYDATTILTLHRDCGPLIAAMAPDFVMIAYGANDAVYGYSPQGFKNNVTQVIQFVRESTRPDLPIILLCDPFRAYLSPDRLENLDHYPGAALQIAQNDPCVCVINSRRLTHDQGWQLRNNFLFMTDGVHYTPYGAITKAQLEMQAFFDAFDDRPVLPCDADFNADTGVDFFDYDDFVNCFEGLLCPGDRTADFNHDTAIDFFDYDDFVRAFESGC
ncbi:MAG: SGNH/GDSL hydrolase family protein [Planctomycetota bacterium]